MRPKQTWNGDLNYELCMHYLLVANGDNTASVGVFSLEALCECSEHDAALDEVVKLHRPHVTSVKQPCTHLAEVCGAEIKIQ